MEKFHPYFSVIILSWNSNHTIRSCLEALKSQIEHDFEVILVDNGSTDPVQIEIVSAYALPGIQFQRLDHNIGFAAGNNYAAGLAKGEYLALLNADAYPQADWLERMHRATQKYPGSFFSSKLLMADQPDRMDGMGDVFHASGLVWRKAYGALVTQVKDEEIEVFSACGAAAVYPAQAFHQAGGFDEDYVSYSEDVDLGFRLRLLGYRCMYIPGAVVQHVGSASTSRRSDLAVYYGHRNLVWTFFKDVPGVWVWLLAPLHLLTNLLLILLGISRKQGRVMLKAKLDAVRGLPIIWHKRRKVQQRRMVSIQKLLGKMDWNPISPLTKLLNK